MLVKNIILGQRIAPEKPQRARELRREMTAAERILWQELRGNKLGAHFRRQQIISGFIVDFYCHKAALVIELDGEVHTAQQAYDCERDTVLRGLGLRVVRIRNEEVIDNLPQVLEQISSLL